MLRRCRCRCCVRCKAARAGNSIDECNPSPTTLALAWKRRISRLAHQTRISSLAQGSTRYRARFQRRKSARRLAFREWQPLLACLASPHRTFPQRSTKYGRARALSTRAWADPRSKPPRANSAHCGRCASRSKTRCLPSTTKRRSTRRENDVQNLVAIANAPPASARLAKLMN